MSYKQTGRNFAYDGADVQMLFGILVSAGTVKEVQEQMAALYSFDSYEDFMVKPELLTIPLMKMTMEEVIKILKVIKKF